MAEVEPALTVRIGESCERERERSKLEARRAPRRVLGAGERGERTPPGSLGLDRDAGRAIGEFGRRTAHELLGCRPVIEHARVPAPTGDDAVAGVLDTTGAPPRVAEIRSTT